MTENRAIAIAGSLRELISMGWTVESFDEDFDNYEGDFLPEEKEEIREIFLEVWDQVQEEIQGYDTQQENKMVPTTTLLRGGDLSDNRITDTVLAWYSDADGYTDDDIKETFDEVVHEVNAHLGDGIIWIPQTSEVIGPVGEKLSLEEFNDILDKAYDKVFGL